VLVVVFPPVWNYDYTRRIAKELVHSGVHDCNHVWTKQIKKTTFLTEVTTTMVKLVDMIYKQATVNTCDHSMNIRNDQWMMLLKAIEAEYYYIEF
jgi:hypothetical protein